MPLKCTACGTHNIDACQPFYIAVADGSNVEVAICDEKAFGLIPRSELHVDRTPGMTDAITLYVAASKATGIYSESADLSYIRPGSLLFYVQRTAFDSCLPEAAKVLNERTGAIVAQE